MTSMTESEPDIFHTSSKVRVKPFSKPDVHLKKSRQRVFSENSIDLIYSFGYQSSFDRNLCMLKENIIIIVAGNHLNFLNTDTLNQDFIPSVNGNSFSSVAVHPSTIFFAAAEKGRKFCVNIFSYPALKVCKTLKEETAIMPTRMMEFHPQGDVLIALTYDPENRIYIWHWEIELARYISSDSPLLVHSLHFSTSKEDIFVTSGEKHVIFWEMRATRNDRDIITKLQLFQHKVMLDETSNLEITCTVSVSNTYISATMEGYLLLWQPESLKFNDVIKIARFIHRPCHAGSIWHIIIYKKYIVTIGSDGYMKFWNYDEIVQSLINFEDKKESDEEEEQFKGSIIYETDEETGEERIKAIQTNPKMEYLLSNTSDLVYGIITKVKFEDVSFLIQDKNGVLFQVDTTSDLSSISVKKLLSGLGSNIIGLVSCPFYPFIAVASSLGNIAVYDCVDQTILKFETFPVSVSCMIWPSAEIDIFGTSFLVGFCDGTIKWIAFSEVLDNFLLKFVIKPHDNAVEFMKANETCTVMISQGSDSKLFFYSVEKFSLTALGYYINHHEVIDFTFLKYFSSSSLKEYHETLLILCKFSYIIESAILDSPMQDNIELRKTYFVECQDCQVYKINGLRQYHQLGDRIYDSDCEETPDLTEAGKAGLRKLKYEEKREKRESHRLELGFTGPATPPEILSYLPSNISNHIWLSLGKEDFGYIFEFEFHGKFSREPVDLIPIRALEILTAEIIPVLSMDCSPCGKFLFMGLEDGSLNLCYLDEVFVPSSGYDFAKFQLHDSEIGPVAFVKVSPEGSFIITAGCDGNILLFKFLMSEYQKIEDYGEKPILSDISVVEDIPAKTLSLEEEIKHKTNEKYRQLKENRLSHLEKLKNEYSTLKDEYNEYLNLCKSSLKKLKDIPEELILNPEELSSSQIAIEMFTNVTKRLQKDIDARYQKDLIKATLQYDKYFSFFKKNVEQEAFTVKSHEDNTSLTNFRSCILPSNVQDIQLSSYPSMYKFQEKDSMHEQRRSGKVWNEKIKLEKQLSALCKAIIEYPSDTPISELITRYNKRKESQIEKLQEHIAEYEILENIVIDDKKYKETNKEIKVSQFKIHADSDNLSSEYWYSFPEKKAKTALYFKKIYKFWNNFNSLLFTALNNEKQVNEMVVAESDMKENSTTDSSHVINLHICYKMEKSFKVFKDAPKINWNESAYDADTSAQKQLKRDDRLELEKEKLQFQKKMCDCFMSVLIAAKPKVNCEKKFCDIRFILKCMELNIFKLDLLKEKKWLKIINELESFLCEQNLEHSSLEEAMLALKNKRQIEKNEWVNLYNQFRKVIGVQNKHKGYFKEVFKRKIRSEVEKESHTRHPSSESSESELDIHSDDDSHDVNPRDVDKNLLKEVMHFRLKRHEIDKRMKECKREMLSLNTKITTLQKKIQKTKDALEDAWKTLSAIPANRKLEIENVIWPAILYPENIHKDFFRKRNCAIQEEKAILYENMSQINKTVLKELKPIDKLITRTLIRLTDKVVNAELMDLIGIAQMFFPLIENVAKEVDEYFMKISCPDSSETLEKAAASEKKPVNIIQEILSAAAIAKEPELRRDSEIKSISTEDTSINKDEKECVKENILNETINSETLEINNLTNSILNLSPSEISVKYDSDILPSDKKKVLKSWREVSDIDEGTSLRKTDLEDTDIKNFISNAVSILDVSLFSEDKPSSTKDYYMMPLTFIKTEKCQKKIVQQPNLTYEDFAKLLFESDISDVLEDLIRKVVEREETSKTEKMLSNKYFPMYPGGGLFLTQDVLLEMEKEDPDHFPYINFYQEIVDVEEKIEIPKQIHIEPHYKEVILKYQLSPVPAENFILLSTSDISRILNAYYKIKISTFECEEQLRLLETKLSKAKRKRVNIEQELVAVSREKTEEMTKKFSRVMDLDHLQDIIENPHLRIRKYESEKKLDLLKKELKKLKATEINALKSLDVVEYEDTLTCHELLQLRQEFKLLNEKHLSNIQNISLSGKKKE